MHTALLHRGTLHEEDFVTKILLWVKIKNCSIIVITITWSPAVIVAL